MNNVIKNWKTTSAGVVLILTGLIHIAFGIIHKSITETDFTTTMVSIVTGVGLIVAGDGTASAQAHEETKQLVTGLQKQIDEVKNQTTTIAKPNQ